MERLVLCQPGCPGGCPAVEVTQNGATIGEGDSLVKLTPEQWNLLVDKVKSGELTPIKEMAADCGCGCGGLVCSVALDK